jgi:predicted TIM-barrel fold metal-dependent hydrolase
MVLALHVGANDYVRTHPYRAAKIAALFPQLPILMVHMGGVGEPHLHREAIEFAAQHDNLMLNSSHAHAEWVHQAIDTLGAHRVCYASDTPFVDMRFSLALHRTLLQGLPSQAHELVMGGNMRRILQL